MKNLVVRALSGAVYVALIVCSILFGGQWAFPALCCIFAFLGIMEFQKITQHDFYDNPRMLFIDLLVGVSIPATIALWLSGVFYIALAMAIFILVLVLIRFIAQLYAVKEDAVRQMANSVLSVVYVAIPLGFATNLLCQGLPQILLLMFVMIWLNDTGAYLVGSALGSHRLFARLSPKKSWEGFFGGLAFCVGAGVLVKGIFPEQFAFFTTVQLAIMGLIVSLTATWGDLFESMIKRTFGVKDSGTLIPGHGGILDRIDSLLFVAPATTIYLIILSAQILYDGSVIVGQ